MFEEQSGTVKEKGILEVGVASALQEKARLTLFKVLRET